ncbi:hypothetical protein GCM10025783_05610 [Amnibacterium soli]|uniref:Disulfide bond formation protein B n=1 Tax=Amnibacterium soli TaxID=1282736 RepID=A0ABP8YUZ9_9MICO
MSADSSLDVMQRDAHPRLLERRGGAVLVVLLLTLGAFVAPVIGWLVGVVLLWSSAGWRTLDKTLGTVIGPVVIGIPLVLRLLHPEIAVSDCTDNGFCAPSFHLTWYQDLTSVGAWLLVTNIALAISLLLRFHVGGARRTPEH